MKLTNYSKPPPKWFAKTKLAFAIISDTVIVFLLARGFSESSFIMLLLRIGISNLLKVIEIFITEDEAPL
ncbi:hypothetical protein [Chitinophaga skermanii]|nr:hypothetical protein [Chitinophaga skermanii]